MKLNLKLTLLYLLLLELFIGGGGRVFIISGYPLRQILFSAILLTYFFEIKKWKFSSIKLFPNTIIILILFWVLISALIGVINANNIQTIYKDVSPMLYFLLYFPLKYYITKYHIPFKYIYKLLLFSSAIVSISCILIYFYLLVYYNGNLLLFKTSEEIINNIFWFRQAGNVFYPGLFFVCITSLLIYNNSYSQSKITLYEKLIYALSVTAIVLSMTKGYVVVVVLGHILISFKKIKSTKDLIRTVTFLSFLLILPFSSIDFSRFSLEGLSADRGITTRLNTISESIEKFNESVIFGNGYGTYLPSKPLHQENSFLDILVEQGLIGFLLYLSILIYTFKHRNINYHLFIILLVSYVLSLTNPYINNPLGIGIIILTLIYLRSGTKNYIE